MNSTKLTLLILQPVCNNQVMNKSGPTRNYLLYLLLSLLFDLIYSKRSDTRSYNSTGSAPSDVQKPDSVVGEVEQELELGLDMDPDMVGHASPHSVNLLSVFSLARQSSDVRPYNSDVGQTPPVSPSAPSTVACQAFYQCDKIRRREWQGI